MQIFTLKSLKDSKRSLSLAFRNLKNLITLVNTDKQKGILREARISVSGKRFLSLILLCLSMGFTTSVFAQANFVASPASVSINPGDPFSVIISLQTGTGQVVDAAEIHMDFDPTILQVTGVTALSNAQQLPTTLITPTFDNTAGTIVYAAGKPLTNDDPEANFQFLQIDFQAIGATDTSIDYVFSFPFRFTDITLGGLSVFGNANNIPVTIASANPDPMADFTIIPNPAETNEVVTFNGALSTDDGSVDSYAWDFGDGTTQAPSSNASATHSYTAINTYTVFLTVTDNLGATNTTSKTIVVNSPSVTQYIVNASSGPNGSIDPEGAVSVNEGADQIFNFTPNSGFEVSEVLVNGSAIIPVPTTSHTLINVTATADISVSFSAIAAPFQLCIASGNDALTALGRSFEADNAASPNPARTGGSFFTGYSGSIAGTTPGSNEELLFQKEVYGGNGGANNALYSIAVPGSGFYQVDLYFAEVFHPSAGGRIFDVFLEGNLMLDEYDLVDPIKDGLGTNQTAITRTYFVQITDGAVDVQIGPASTDNGKISGICVTEVSSANLHPVASIGDLTYEALIAVADPLNIVDPENDVLSVVLNGMPASLTYNPTTNQLEGTPLATDANTYTINAIISDGTNSPVTEEFTLVINPVAGDDPPIIDAIADLAVNEGEAISQAIMVTDDNLPAATIEIFDVSEGGTNIPFNPTTAVAVGTLVDNTGGSYTFNWTPAAGTGRSYLARVTADDGVNPVVIEEFRIDVAQQLPGIILARTFNNPIPWYGSSAPGGGLTVAIETSAAKNIGYINAGDFVEYLIDVPATGTYDLVVSAAKGGTGTTNITFLEESGSVFSPIGSVGVVNNGAAWQDYADYNTAVTFVNAGPQTLRLEFDGGANVELFTFISPLDTPPTIDAIADLAVNEGEAISQAIMVTDDNLPAATIEIFDVSEGGDNNPFNPTTAVVVGTLVDNTGGSYTFNWTPAAGTGRSYLARVTADDGVNPGVIEEFKIDVAQQLPGIILARTFNNPLPFYGPGQSGSGGQDFSVAIETAGNIGYIENNDFVEYLINVPTTGDYDVRFNSSNGSGETGSSTDISILEEGNATPIGTITVPKAGWGNFQNFTTTVTFANSGLQILRLNFDGGVNTNEFEFTLPTSNNAPVVTITSPADGIALTTGTSLNFTGSVTDVEDDDATLTAALNWSSDLQGNLGTGPNFSIALTVIGTHTITAEVTDSDLITPLTGTATITLVVTETDPSCDARFRVNAGGPLLLAGSGDFEEDQATALVGGTAQTGTPSTYVNTAPPAFDKTFGNTTPLVSNTTGYPDYLFQTERYSDAANPNNMQWSFPTGDGVFDVKILFNENWVNENANVNNNRIFDVIIEGDIVLDDYRPSGPTGADFNVAKVETYQATVTDGVLNIDFEKINQNPAVKGFDICFISDITTLPPVFTLEIPDQNNLEGDTPTGLAVAANDPDGGVVTFSDNGTLPPGLSIDPNTGAISGTINAGAATNSPYNVVITATDDEPENETSAFTWTVNAPVTLPLCINSGNQGPVTAFGKPFIADSFVTPAGGNFYNTPDTQAIAGTTPGSGEEDMFQSEHWTGAAGGLQYAIPTGNGDFTIDLYMAELFANAANARLLDISIEGVTVLTGLDLFGTYGKFTAATLTYSTTVNDGFLDIVITSTADNPKLNGLCVSLTPANTPPTVTITGPVDINVSRGTNVNFTGQADDVPDGNISANLSWSTDDTNASFASGITSGSAVDISFVRPGSTIVTSDVSDSGGLPGTDSFTVNVSAPEVTFLTPANSAELSSTTVNVQLTPVDVLFANAEHFHFYINPPDENNLDPNKRISTASLPEGTINFIFDEDSGLDAADGLGNGIVEGENTIIVFVADQFHNEFSNAAAKDVVTFNVVIPDTEDPVVVCPADITVDNDAGVCGAVVNFTPTATDNSGSATVSALPMSGTFFDVGTTTVVVTAEDASGNTATCSFDVTVNDTEDPVLTCPADDSVDVDTNGEFILADYTALAAVSDNCDNSFTVTQSPVAGTTLSADTQVTLSVTDNASNTGTCTFNVTISTDTTDPVISCPADIVVDNDPDLCGAVVTFTAPIGTDERPGASTFQLAGLNSGDVFPLGITTQTFQVVDAANNMATCSFTVTVNDGQAPDITCPVDITMTSLSGNPIVISDIGTATATDNCPGIVAIAGVTLIGDLPIPDTFPPGITQIKWTATDEAGNVAQCIQDITVNFTPSNENAITAFSLPNQVGPEVITVSAVNLTVAVGTDLSVPIVPSNIAISDFAMISPDPGAAQIFSAPFQYTVTAQDNSTQVWTVNVTVEPDTEDPTVTCPADITVNSDPGQCGAVVTYTVPVGTDNLPGATTALTAGLDSGELFPVGITTVTYTVTDAAGLTASCSFNVTVNDTENPVITCPADITENVASGVSSAVVNYVAPSGTDNCPGANTSQTAGLGSGASFPLGTTTETYAVTDAAGNSVSCSFTVTVEELPTGSLVISPTSMEVTLFPDQTADVNYVVDSDNATTLPTPAAMQITDDATGIDATWAATTSAANQGVPYEVIFNSAGLAPGTYMGLLTAGPVTGYTDASIPITLIVEPAVGNAALIVLDATTDTPLFDLTDGLSIPKSSIGNTPLGVIFNADLNPGGVKFTLTGPLNESRNEGPAPPHSLFGDIGVDIQGKPFPIGNYTLVADPKVGPTITVSFAVTDVDPLCVNFDANISGIINPSTCTGVGSATVVPSGGVSPFTYTWDNGETTATANNLVTGPHSATVADVNGCSKTLNFTLTGPPLPNVTLAPFANVLNTEPAFTLTGGLPTEGTYSGAGVTGNMFNPAVVGVGTYAITYSYTDSNGCSNTATQSITVTTETSNAALIVLDATDDSVLFALTDGLQINKADIGNTPLGIIYNSSLNPGGVQFNLTGPINESRFEGPAPHSLFGDIGVNIQGKPFPVGNYTLIANPNSGPTQTINFSVIDGPPGNQSPVAVASGTVDPVTPFKINFSSAGSMDPDGNIIGYLWNFGDGMTSIAQNPMHIYATGGTKTVTLTVTDNENATGSVTIQVTAVDPDDVDKVVTFTLVDAVADDDIIDMTNNYVINNGTGINIRANTDPGVVGSVKFVLSGAVSYTSIESFAPYALYGDNSGDYNPTDLPVGLYTITATPYSASGGNGTAGQPLTIDFSVGLVPLAAKAPVNTMSIAPNPANEKVTMTFEKPAQIQEIMIFDVTGRLIRTIKEPQGLDDQTIDIKVYDLPIGTYFLKTRDDKGFEYQQQMLIDRY